MHLIPSLGSGGAEAMLTKLITKNKEKNVSMIVVTLLNNDHFYKEIKNSGTKIYKLNIFGGLLGPFKIFYLIKIIFREKPDILQTWMYHCDFIGIFIKIIFPKVKVVWNVRHSNLIKKVDKNTTIHLAKILGFLSFVPNHIICGSQAAAEQHIKLGYKKKKIIVIPNGFDTNIFSPNERLRNNTRKDLGVGENMFLIGHIGREKKIKNQKSLIDAFSSIHIKHKNTMLILIGKGIKEKYSNHPLVKEKRIILLNEQKEVQQYLRAFDLFVLPSLSEGFPNVLGEAMSCGVPCVSTDVGDSAKIVGNPNLIAQRNSTINLSDKIQYWLNLTYSEKENLKKVSRERILNFYSIEKVVEMYLNAYRN